MREKARRSSLCGLLCLAMLVLLAKPVRAGGPTVVGYYPDWNRSVYPHTTISYQSLTHIAHAFLIPNSDGSLSGTSGFAYPELVTAAHTAGVKVVVALGGWGGSGGFSGMAADSASRSRFVQNIVDFCETNGYDGVDLDWEYPANLADRANLTVLVNELRQAFVALNRPMTISLAIPAGDWSGRWFDVGGMKNDVDWYGVMTYDFFGSWTSTSGPNSPLYGTLSINNQGWIDYSVSYYTTTRSLPPDKITIGIPFYGQVFSASSMYGPSTGATQKTYRDIVPYLAQGWTRYWDSLGQVPYLINPAATQVVSYDDSASVALKCSYAVGKGVQGAILWAIGQDYLNGQQPLLDVVGRGFGLVTDIESPTVTSPPPTFCLEQNFPNPFNPSTVIQYSIPGSRDQGVGVREVRLVVFDLLGREVSVLVNEKKSAGSYEVTFDASGLTSGVYFYMLTSGSIVQTNRMVLIK